MWNSNVWNRFQHLVFCSLPIHKSKYSNSDLSNIQGNFPGVFPYITYGIRLSLRITSEANFTVDPTVNETDAEDPYSQKRSVATRGVPATGYLNRMQ